MNEFAQTRDWLAPKEVARELRVHVSSVYRSVEQGRLPALRLTDTGAIRIHRSALRAPPRPLPKGPTTMSSYAPPAIEELTIGELRRALAQGDPTQTLREALKAIAERDEVSREHEQHQLRYAAYTKARELRLATAEQEAMAAADDEQQRTGRPWPHAEARFEARREAGLAERERFELNEPLLQFEDWVQAGCPDRYRAETTRARAEHFLKRFESLAG